MICTTVLLHVTTLLAENLLIGPTHSRHPASADFTRAFLQRYTSMTRILLTFTTSRIIISDMKCESCKSDFSLYQLRKVSSIFPSIPCSAFLKSESCRLFFETTYNLIQVAKTGIANLPHVVQSKSQPYFLANEHCLPSPLSTATSFLPCSGISFREACWAQ